MTGPSAPPDRDNAILSDYLAGRVVSAIAAEYRTSPSHVYELARGAGVPLRGTRGPNSDRAPSLRGASGAIAESYSTGESELSLARRLGVSRSTIRTRLLGEGVAVRGVTEANALAAGRGDPTRHRRNSVTGLTGAALSARNQRWVGASEHELEKCLRQCGIEVVAQAPLGVYNIDLLAGAVAVEVETGPVYPLLKRVRERRAKRLEYLLDGGMRVVFVWVTSAHPLQCDKIVPWVELAQSHPAVFGEYRVIRGSGQDATRL